MASALQDTFDYDSLQRTYCLAILSSYCHLARGPTHHSPRPALSMDTSSFSPVQSVSGLMDFSLPLQRVHWCCPYLVVNLTGNYTIRFLLVSYCNVFTTRIWEVWVEICHVALQGVLPSSVFPRVSASVSVFPHRGFPGERHQKAQCG